MSRLLFEYFFAVAAPTTSPPTPIPPTPGAGTIADAALDLLIDPVTRDFVDTPNGLWVETSDSRTAVYWQLESIFQAWWADPPTGTRLRAIMSGDEPGDASDVRDEALRGLQMMVDDGVLTDLSVTMDKDENGRLALLLAYTDRASGRPVDLAFVPFGA